MRKTIAAIVAVAVLSTGSAACTPQQAQHTLNGLGNLITLILFSWAMGTSHSHYGQTTPPTTAPPVTVPEPVGT